MNLQQIREKLNIEYNNKSKKIDYCGCSTRNTAIKNEAWQIFNKMKYMSQQLDDFKLRLDSMLSDVNHSAKKMDRDAELQAYRFCGKVKEFNGNMNREDREDKLLELAEMFDDLRKRDNVERLIREKHENDQFFDALIEVHKLLAGG